MKTKLFILVVLVMVLCCITSVSAVDANMTEIALEEPADDVDLQASADVDVIGDTNEKIDADINVTIPEDMAVGGRYVINVTMPKDADDWIDVYYDDEDSYFTDTYLEKGIGSFKFVPTETGNHTLRLNYYGNNIYNEKDYYYSIDVNGFAFSLKKDRVELEDTLEMSLNVPGGFNGTVEVTINGKKYYATYDEDYEYSYVFYVNGSDLEIGDNEVTLYYGGDDRFPVIPSKDTLNIFNRKTVTMTVEYPENVVACQPFEFNVTLSADINDTLWIEYYYSDEYDGYWEGLDDVEIVNGKCTYPYVASYLGQRTWRFAFSGNDEYRPVYQPVSFNVENYTVYFDSPVEYKSEIEFGLSVPSGFYNDLEVTIDEDKYTFTSDDDYSITRNFNIGNHTVNIYYPGDSKFHMVNITKNLEVIPFVIVTSNSFPVGADEYINCMLPADANGTFVVCYSNGSEFGRVKVEDGQASFSLRNLDVGEYNMSVRYEGDAKYSVNTNVRFNVHPEIDVPDCVLEGDEVIITMYANEGNLTVYDADDDVINSSEFKDGVAKISLGKLHYSKYVTVKYVNDNYTYVGKFRIQVITIDLSIKNGSYVPNSSSSFDCIVGPEDSYLVKLYFDEEYVDDYTVYYDYYNVPFTGCNMSEGQHTLEVVVMGLSKKVTFNVFACNLTAPSYIFAGDDANITIQMPEEFDEKVIAYYYDEYDDQCYINCEKLAAGMFVIPLSNLGSDSYRIYLQYKGENTTFNIGDRRIRVFDIDISIENNTVLSSDVSFFRVKIGGFYGDAEYYFDGNFKTSFDAWGSTFYFDDGDLTNGKHSIEIRFDYNGDLISKKVSFTVLSPEITAPSAILAGDDSNITVILSDEFEGNITAYANSEEFSSVKVTDGKAVVPLNSLSANDYTIQLKYDDGNITFTRNVNLMVFDVDISIENNTVSSDTQSFDLIINPAVYNYINYYLDGELKSNFYPYGSYSEVSFYDGDLTNGNHTIEIRFDYNGDQISKKVSFHVVSINVTVPKYNLAGNDSSINVKVPEGMGGNVTAYVKSNEWNSEYEQFVFENINNDEANISLVSLTPGDKWIKIEYRSGDLAIVREVELKVLGIELSIEDDSVVFSQIDDLYVDLKTWWYGDVFFKFDGEDKSNQQAGSIFTFSLYDCNLSEGRHTIEIICSDTDYTASKMIQFNTTSVLITIPEKIAKNSNNEGIEFYAIVKTQSDATGNITCIVDGSQFNFQELWGWNDYYIDLSVLEVGDHDVEIIYSGDDSYPRTNKTGKVHVDYVPYIESTYLVYDRDDLKMIVQSAEDVVVKIDGNETQYVIDGHNLVVPKSLLSIGEHNLVVETASGMELNVTFWVVGSILYDGQRDEIYLTLPEDANGALVIEINKFNSTTGEYEKIRTEEIPMADGKAVFENDLIPDDYQLVCTYNGTDYDVRAEWFYPSSEPRYKLDKSEIYVNESAVASIIVKNNIGNFTIEISKDWNPIKTVKTPIVDNRANITISDLAYGRYSIRCSYEDGESYYYGNDFTLEVLRHDVDMGGVEVADIDKGQTAFVNIELPGDATGFVYVYVDGKMVAKLKANATISVPLENLTVGAHPFEVEYEGDTKYLPNSTIKAFIVNDIKLKSDINATCGGIFEGQTAVISVNVTEDATGLVLVTVDGKKYFEEISEGKVIVNIDNLKAGNYTAIVTYNGDDKYNKSSAEVAITVNEKEDSIIVITNSALSIGESVTITATVNGMDADVAYTINGVEGATIDFVKAINYTVTASFAGNATHKANSTTKTFTVKKLTSEISVDVKDAKVGQVATITVNVTKGATGDIAVKVGEAFYFMQLGEENVLKLVIYNASVYNVMAVYSGDDIYNESVSSKYVLNITDKAPANINVTGPDYIKVGDVAVFNITFDTTAEIKAIMGDETVPIVDGTITLGADKEGIYTVTIFAEENADFYGQVGYIVFEAVKNDASVEIVLPEKITVGEDMVISVLSNSDAPVVVFIDGVAQNVTDKTVTIKAVAGTHTVVASVDENVKYTSAADNKTFTVEKLVSEIKVDVKDVKAGNTAVISVNVTEGATGAVLVRVGDEVYAIDLDDGNSVAVTLRKSGSYVVLAYYFGDNIYDTAVSDKVILNVTDKAPANINVVIPDDIWVGDVVVFNITYDTTAEVMAIMDNETIPIVDGTISVTADEQKMYIIQIVAFENEDFLYDELAISFAPLKNDASVEIVLPENITVGKDMVISVVSDSDAPVVVFIDGVAQNVTDNTVTIKAVAGTHTVVAGVAETGKYLSTADNKTFTVERLATEVKVDVKDVKAGNAAIISVNVTEGATGLVLVRVGDEIHGIDLDKGNSVAVTLNESGSYNVSALYLGDYIYNAALSDMVVLNVTDKAPANINVVAPDDIWVGDVAVFNITYDTTAEVMAIMGNETIPIVNGIISVTADEQKMYIIQIVAFENEDFLYDELAIAFVPLKNDASVEIVLPEKITVGEDMVISVVSDSDAPVVVFIDGEAQNVTDNTVTIKAVAGTHTVIAGVAETGKYNSAADNKTFTVERLSSEVKVDVKDIKTGGTALITVDVTEGATGVVLVHVGDEIHAVNLDEGNFVAVTLRESGSYDVSALYLGDDIYDTSVSDKVVLNVTDKAPANIDVTGPSGIKVGDVVVFNITADTTAEIKAIMDGETVPIVNGTITITAEKQALYEIYVFAAENDEFLDDGITIEFIPAKNNATVAIALPENITAGDDIVISVESDSDADVVVYIDGEAQKVVDNKVTFRASPGTHTVVATVGETEKFKNAMDLKAFTVERQTSVANVTIGDIKVGEDTPVKVDIPGATGNVSVIVDGVETVVPLDENGTAVVPVTATAGEHSIVVVYSGDETHSPVVKTATFNAEVFASEFTNLTVSGDMVIEGVLVNSLGDPIANAEISYAVGGVSGKLTTGSDGSFAIAGASNTVVTIAYAGTNDTDGTNVSIRFINIAPARIASQFNVTAGTSIPTYAVDFGVHEPGTNFKFRLTDSQGNPIVNATVDFAYKTVYFNRTTDENGCVNLGINTQIAGQYLCALSYLGDETHNAVFVPFSFNVQKKSMTISAASKSYNAAAKTKKYSVTLKTQKSVDGKTYLKAGKKVTMKINGVTYTAKTNDKGQATFSLKLTKKGKFTAKLDFAGDVTYEAASKSVRITIK